MPRRGGNRRAHVTHDGERTARTEPVLARQCIPKRDALEPFHDEPLHDEPLQLDPFQLEPFQVEPFQVEPFQLEPFQEEPSQVE